MNMETSGFFSRDAKRTHGMFLDRDDVVYFIEDKVTGEWLSKNINLSEWTRDPHRALSFKNYFKASTFANQNKIYGKGIIITEHQFL